MHTTEPTDSTIPALDLSACEREPIHVPGAVQPHGLLLVLDAADLTIIQASANAPVLVGRDADALLGAPVAAVIGEEGRRAVRGGLDGAGPEGAADEHVLALETPAAGEERAARRWIGVLHRTDAGVLLELEPPGEDDDVVAFIDRAAERLREATTVRALCDGLAREVRHLTGFDRVKVYEFDADWNGQVVAEDRAPHMDTYLGLHFPASDIPAQARRLYVLNRTRLIADAGYTPVPVVPASNPATGAPLDLTHSVLRSVSPVHLEYLANMGVGASMSVSILVEDELWGLVACHHATPRFVGYRARLACSLLAQIASFLLTSRREIEDRAQLARRKSIQARLLEAMIHTDAYAAGLEESGRDLLDLVGAQGGVIWEEGVRAAFGEVPDAEALADLTAWLAPRLADGPFATDRLSSEYPPAEAYRPVGSGLLAVSLSRLRPVYLLWFRPELLRTVTWAGAPSKAVRAETDGSARLHPRRSFEAWKEVVRGRSEPWRPSQVAAAQELRAAIVDVVFAQAERIRRLNTDLERANRELQDFAYVASHDLQEPLRKVQAFADLLEKDHSHALDEDGRFYVERMRSAAGRMGTLIMDLLALSRVATRGENFVPVDLTDIARRSLEALDVSRAESDATITIEPLCTVEADASQIRQLFQNLIGNALKYRRQDVPPEITVRSHMEEHDGLVRCHVEVADNGIGFEERFLEKIFTPFQRLHARGTFTGTGMGLAICRRIVERHGGTITAQSTPGKGSTFVVTLPVTQTVAN